MEMQVNVGCKACEVERQARKVPVTRFIEKLDEFFAHNDLVGAERYLDYWEKEAASLSDEGGLLTVLNEKIGFYRRNAKAEQAVKAIENALSIMKKPYAFSYAVVFVNIATTYKNFGYNNEALQNYDTAEDIFKAYGKTEGYDYAAFKNNKGSALADIGEFESARDCFFEAIELLKKAGGNDGDIAISYVNLAHLYEKTADMAAVNNALDTAWDYITSSDIVHDGKYAFICEKCAPSYKYFGRTIEGDALQETANEIYNGN